VISTLNIENSYKNFQLDKRREEMSKHQILMISPRTKKLKTTRYKLPEKNYTEFLAYKKLRSFRNRDYIELDSRYDLGALNRKISELKKLVIRCKIGLDNEESQ